MPASRWSTRPAAARIHPNDSQRIQRALEVHAVGGRPISELQTATRPALEREFHVCALLPADRVRLHADLERRFAQMMAAGLLDEVRGPARAWRSDRCASCTPRRRLPPVVGTS
jgi:tRNA A37 N6-isopentenylltransferase MiaA